MPTTQEGEFELVLGNKQLLSVFFIVVVLLGVFFTMGYIVGRNTAETTQAAMAPSRPLVVEAGAVPGAAPVATPPAPRASTDVPSAAAPKPRPVPTAAAKPAPKPPAATPKPAAVTRTPKPKPAAAKPRVRQPPASSPPVRASSGQPGAGDVYLQVAATKTPEGGVLLDVLKKRGFNGRLASVPGQDLVRVLVGPVNGPDELSRTRTALQEAGFKPFTRRY
ncbi:MAG: SPOR domain-containing protein [bacterium]|nr:SPOR domain-containing protein [bacterium]